MICSNSLHFATLHNLDILYVSWRQMGNCVFACFQIFSAVNDTLNRAAECALTSMVTALSNDITEVKWQRVSETRHMQDMGHLPFKIFSNHSNNIYQLQIILEFQ